MPGSRSSAPAVSERSDPKPRPDGPRPADGGPQGRSTSERALLEVLLLGDCAGDEVTGHEHVVVGGVVLRGCLRVVAGRYQSS